MARATTGAISDAGAAICAAAFGAGAAGFGNDAISEGAGSGRSCTATGARLASGARAIFSDAGGGTRAGAKHAPPGASACAAPARSRVHDGSRSLGSTSCASPPAAPSRAKYFASAAGISARIRLPRRVAGTTIMLPPPKRISNGKPRLAPRHARRAITRRSEPGGSMSAVMTIQPPCSPAVTSQRVASPCACLATFHAADAGSGAANASSVVTTHRRKA